MKYDNCEKEIGILERKYDYDCESGKSLIFCSDCNQEAEDKFEKEEKGKIINCQ